MDHKPTVEVIEGSNRPNISFNGRLLYSDTNSPEKRAESLPKRPEALYIVISPLLFHGAEAFIRHIPTESAVLCIEREPAIYANTVKFYEKSSLRNFDYILIDDNNPNQIYRYISKYRFREIIPVKLNHGYMLERRYYDNFINEAKIILSRFWKNRMTTIHMGRLWCRNIFLNLKSMPEGSFISRLKTDKPVFCVGAGESLESSLDFIVHNRDKFFLTAADTAVSSLLSKGIKPDLAIALESQHANLYDFYNNDSLDIPVAVDLTSSPELIRKLRGPVYFFITEFDYSSIFGLLDEYGLLPTLLPALGSVGITSLLISLMITERNVAFSGLDFSFIPDKYHASGSPSHIINMLNEGRTNRQGFYQAAFTPVRTRVADKSGRGVYTDITMRSYADSLNQLIDQCDRLIDAGSLGLPNNAPKIPETQLINCLESELSASTPLSFKTIYNKTSDQTDAVSRDVIKDFLSSQNGKINSVIRDIVKFQNNRNENSKLNADLIKRLNEIDYTWLFFPDKSPLPNADSSFLKRFLFSAAWFSGQIEKSLSLVNHRI